MFCGGRENEVLLLKIIFSSHQNKSSDVNKTYIDISNGQKYELLVVQKKIIPVNYSSFSDCTVKEDFYGHTFNLTNLHGKIDKKVKDTRIEINICGAGLLNSQCGPDAAICDGDKLVAKTSKETLSFSSGRLELSYEGKLESIYRRKFSL